MTTWLDFIEARGFGGWTRTHMVREVQRTRFPGHLPAGFGFLRGPFVELGFEKLGLMTAELDAVLLAFVGVGVAVPGTPWRLRFVRPVLSVIEPRDGREGATLPGHWREGVLAAGRDGECRWAVTLVPPDRRRADGPRESRGAGAAPVPGGDAPTPTPPESPDPPRQDA